MFWQIIPLNGVATFTEYNRLADFATQSIASTKSFKPKEIFRLVDTMFRLRGSNGQRRNLPEGTRLRRLALPAGGTKLFRLCPQLGLSPGTRVELGIQVFVGA